MFLQAIWNFEQNANAGGGNEAGRQAAAVANLYSLS